MNLGPLATSVLAAASLGTFSADSQVTVTNRTQFHDTEGNVIHAHGGGLLKSAEFHYWYGEHRDGDNHFLGVSCYRSTNLARWEYRGDVLKDASAPELKGCVIERPKVCLVRVFPAEVPASDGGL